MAALAGGCYAFLDSAGRPGEQALDAPPLVWLDPAPAGGAEGRPRPAQPGARRAVPLDSEGRARSTTSHRAPAWRAYAGGSVGITFHTGFVGTAFALAVDPARPDTLRGSADWSSDNGPRHVHFAGVRAVRRPCPTPGPP